MYFRSYSIYHVYFLCLCSIVPGICPIDAQNIVPNPSFETYTNCPTGLGTGNLECTPWVTPTLGTEDYFNACNTGDVGVPANLFGNQAAHTGDAYVGGYSWGSVLPDALQ